MTRESRRALQVASVASLAASFATAKTVAVIAGPTGVGFQGAILSGGSLTALLATWAAANNLPQLAARRPAAGGRDFASAITRATAAALLPAAILTWALVLPELLEVFSTRVAILGMAFGTSAALLTAVQPTMLTVFNQPGAAAKYQLAASFGGTILTILAVLALPDSLLPVAIGGGLLAGQAVGLILTRGLVQGWRANDRVPLRWFIGGSTTVFGSTLLSAGTLAAVPLLTLRWAGPDVTGLLRASISLGGIPSAIFITSVSLHYYPEITNLRATGASTQATTADSVRVVGRLAAWASMGIAAVAPLTLWFAYSREFTSASSALALALAAGLVRLMALHNAFLILAQHRTKAYLGTEALAAAVLLSTVTMAAQAGSVSLLSGALWLSNAVHFATTAVLLRRESDPGAVFHIQPKAVLVGHVVLPLLATVWLKAGTGAWIPRIGV